MLALVLACTISTGGMRAQMNAEYKFRQQSVVNGTAYDANGDPVPVLSMDCLAANGYGQWAFSSTPGQGSYGGISGANEFPAGWYLLENGMYAPSVGWKPMDAVHHPYCIPPGVVQSGPLSGGALPTELEVTANLDGTEDYVWPDRTTSGATFVVNQFTTNDVDISLAFLSNPTPWTSLSNPGNMMVVTNPIHNASPEIPTSTSCGCSGPTCDHNVVTTSPYQDEFQITCDARFLYIVWCSSSNLCAAPTSEVWATVVYRATLTTVSGWPKELGNGLKPTVACDPRNNRTSNSPAFEAAWLRLSPSPNIRRVSCVAGALGTPYSLATTYVNPSLITMNYSGVSHARILVSSAPGVSPTTALYAIVQDEMGQNALVFYESANSTTAPANYVDGVLEPPDPSMVSLALTPGPVVDNFITAFANPYDYLDNHSGLDLPDQFHCVYQMTTPPTYSNPLQIVQGCDNNTFGVADTRLILNQSGSALLGDPTKYVAAVNQMGIHVHWLSNDGGGTHYYARDTGRAFDEPIEENTLVTNRCTVANGTSHGGTVGATVTRGSQVTVWSDPNYGPPGVSGSNFYGLYSPIDLTTVNKFVGTLNFAGSNVKLTVGGDTYFDDDCDCQIPFPASLSVMPFIDFYFNNAGQGVTIEPNCSFDYWGLIATHGSTTTIASPFNTNPYSPSTSTIDLEGSSPGYPAYLNVHGGSDFFLGVYTNLIENNSVTNVFDEAPMYPTTNGTPNSPTATGHMTLWAYATLSNSTIYGNATNPTSTYPGNDVILTSYGTFSATTGGVSNNTNTGLSTIQFGDYNGNGFTSATITDGLFSAANIHALNGACTTTLSVEGSSFDQLRNYGILAEGQTTGDPAQNTRPIVTISGNYFLGFAPNAASEVYPYPNLESGLGPQSSLFGIWLRNFAHIPESDVDCDLEPGPYIPWNKIDVELNQFQETGNFNDTLVNNLSLGSALFMDFDAPPTSAAILLENTSANVTSNTIEDNGYSVGIGAVSDDPGHGYNTPFTSSLICSNTISGLSNPGSSGGVNEELGMFTADFNGFVQNNTITGCDNGYSAGGNGNGTGGNTPTHFICNTLSGNRHITIDVNDYATLDMSGIHSNNPSSYDYPGFNNISGPSTWIGPDNYYNEVKLILISQYSGGDLGTINLSNSLKTWNWGTNSIGTYFYGCNSITASNQTSGVNQPLIEYDGSSNMEIRSVDWNYFGYGIDPSNGSNPCSSDPFCLIPTPCYTSSPYSWPASSGVTNALRISYCATPNATAPESATALPPWASDCQNWVDYLNNGTKKKRIEPLESEDTIVHDCSWLLNYGVNANSFDQYQESYDTLMKCVDSCAQDPETAGAFGPMTDDVENLLQPANYNQDSAIWAQYRAWLYNVLYLNTTDPSYFCACVGQIFGSFGYAIDDTSDQQGFIADNESVAFMRWALLNTNCDSSSEWDNWQHVRREQFQMWLQDSLDGIHYPFDTTIPTLSQIGYGLDTLLAKHAFYASVSETPQPGIISNAAAYPNPTGEGTVISFGISKEAYVKIELFDVLGHEVGSAGFESLFEPGNKSVPLSLAGLPSGTYFARIQTAYGEAQSVKLVKQ